MQITIDQTDGTLPFITELPSFGIGQLEGYNGVGKSLTVSVLEVCAGSRPRMESQAWAGFCDGMGQLTVKVTDLRGVDELMWVLDGPTMKRASEDVGPEAPPELRWFVDVRVDGRPAHSLDEVRALFAVERVNGDVGLIEELAGRADAAGRALDAFSSRLLGSDKLDQAEEKLSSLRMLLDELSVARIAERADEAVRRRADRQAAEVVMRAAVERRERIEDAVRLRTRLGEIELSGADLDSEIAALDRQIDPLRDRWSEVGRQLEAAEKAAAQTEDLRSELAKATRSYKAASTRLRNVTADLAQANQIAGIRDDDDPKARRAELEELRGDVRRRRVEVDAGPAVVELINQVRPPLNQAAASGLGEQPLLSAPSRAPSAWTVAEVSDALVRRRDELGDIPSPRDAQRLDEQLDVLRSQLRALDDVVRLREERVKASERQNDAQQRSRQLTEQLDKTATEHLDALRNERRELDDRLSELGGERTVLTYRRDALGAPQQRDALAGQFAELLEALSLSEERVDAAYAKALQTAEHERDAFLHLRDLERAAVGDHERDLAELRRAIEELHGDGYRWLPRATIALPAADQSLDAQLRAVEHLKRAAHRADDRLTAFRQLFPGLRASLDAVADELRGREARAAVRVEEVFAWLQQDAVAWFADEDFRDALLSKDAADITVNLRERQVSWTTDGDERHAKPIEALSSGERAFAFTQARLALLQQQAGAVANRLIALDEFGAFVSANRIRQLAEYLQRWRDNHRGDQILVILPANQDYEALARASDGAQAARYARMAQALHEREWFVEEFNAP